MNTTGNMPLVYFKPPRGWDIGISTKFHATLALLWTQSKFVDKNLMKL